MDIIIEKNQGEPVAQSAVEIVERKGMGHPDTLCDTIAEELSIALSRHYAEHFGRILHHNIDKCLLVGGHSEVSFGGGKVTRPIRIIIAGRATENAGNKKIPLDEIAIETTHSWLQKQMRFLEPEKNVIVETRIGTGSEDLRATYDNSALLANDTSIGVGFGPMTELETIVYKTEQFLNSTETKNIFPMVGEDVKIIGIRRYDYISLTIAIAFVSKFIYSKKAYYDAKSALVEQIDNFVRKHTDKQFVITINAADNPEKDMFYLTVTGLSAECGDDGQVGRGNRANGLITPYRPMTLEAAAGKNPVTHTGKLYNLIANEITKEITNIAGVTEAECYLASQIGKPIVEPQIVHLKIFSGLSQNTLEKKCKDIVKKRLQLMPELWKDVLERRYTLF